MHEELSGPGVIEWLGVRYKTILPATETGGALSVVDSLNPVGSGPPRHVHEQEDETFVILVGEYEFWMEGQTIPKKAGETVFVPRGREHTFRVVGARPSRHLTIHTPARALSPGPAPAHEHTLWTLENPHLHRRAAV
jgi:mannose-6-phosphate isomerase-like protein (cupin superfamily)